VSAAFLKRVFPGVPSAPEETPPRLRDRHSEWPEGPAELDGRRSGVPETSPRSSSARAGTAFIAVSFPSAAEVQAELTAFTRLLDAQGVATDRSNDEAQDVEDIRPRIGLAILESWDDIANKYRRLPGPAYRRLAREWDVIFHSRPGEAPEEGVTPAPAEAEPGNPAAAGSPPA
jgi:hypothetical protein